jgi:hypothetical protein
MQAGDVLAQCFTLCPPVFGSITALVDRIHDADEGNKAELV